MTITPAQLRRAEQLAKSGGSLIISPDPPELNAFTGDDCERCAAKERYRRNYEAIFGKQEPEKPTAADIVLPPERIPETMWPELVWFERPIPRHRASFVLTRE
jgi:hypothetical protein